MFRTCLFLTIAIASKPASVVEPSDPWARGIMYSFRHNKTVSEAIDDLYASLKGRSDGTVPAGTWHGVTNES